MFMIGRSLLAALLLTTFVVVVDTDELQGGRQARSAPDEGTDYGDWSELDTTARSGGSAAGAVS